MVEDISLVLGATSRLAAPLLFAGLGELLAERAGTLNISVEAMFLGSAFTAAVASSETGSPLIGLVVGMLTGLLVAAVQGVLSHKLTINQFIVGLTLNVLVLGVTSFLLIQVDLKTVQFGILHVPWLASIPVVGAAMFVQPWPFFTLYPLCAWVWWVIHRSQWGAELHAVGENPASADATGIRVNKRRREALYVCGILSGMAGAYLSVGVVGTFTENMTAQRGFIVIAAVIFGGWTLSGTVLGCLLFGGADALRLSLPAIGLTINAQLLIAAPYLLALIGLSFVSQRQRQPAALAVTFRRR